MDQRSLCSMVAAATMVAFLGGTVPGLAQSALPQPAIVAAPATTPAQSSGKGCSCRLSGIDVEVGESRCLTVDGRSYLAICTMNLNNTSWQKLEDGCPTA